MVTKPNWLLVTLLQVALLGPASAADKKPDECGLASIYSNVSNETASGEDTVAENFTAAHRTLPFGTLVNVDNRENGRWAVCCGSPIVALTSTEELLTYRRLPHANSAFPV